MAASLYRKYRPQRFSELIGQNHVAKALQNALAENRLAHAYLFSGTRGTGKTSTARILGAVLNCQTYKDGFPSDASEIEPCGECESCIAARAGNSFDVIELDAASNNGVDDMRDLIEKVSYTSAAGGTKVYIIDEVHELTGRASNALLKTLEEPPEHVVFILATTNPEKVLPTIRSRTQHFEFVSPSNDELFAHAQDILQWEEKSLDDEALSFVVRKGAGSVRDTLSYLDQVLALDVTTMEQLEDAHAISDTSTIVELILAVGSGDIAQSFDSLHALTSGGKEPRAIAESIVTVARDCLVLSLSASAKSVLSNHSDLDELKNVGDKCGTAFLTRFILQLGKAIADMRGVASVNPLLNVEMALLSSIPSTAAPTMGSTVPAVSSAPPARPEIPRVPAAPVAPSPAREVPAVPVADEPARSSRTKGATLGALKGASSIQEPVPSAPSEKAKPAAPTVSSRVTIDDVTASWSKVVGLLSVASQDSIKKATPISLEGDVLTFGVAPSEIDEVKSRLKKDAAIVRGFLESIHEKQFRFQVVESEDTQPTVATREITEQVDISTDDEESLHTLMEESEEYNPVDAVVSMFNGEVISE